MNYKKDESTGLTQRIRISQETMNYDRYANLEPFGAELKKSNICRDEYLWQVMTFETFNGFYNKCRFCRETALRHHSFIQFISSAQGFRCAAGPSSASSPYSPSLLLVLYTFLMGN